MEAEKSYAKKDLRYSCICRLFIEGGFCFLLLRIIIAVIEVIRLCHMPEAGIELTDTGYSYRFELLLGYAQCGYENLPMGAEMAGRRIFCIAWVVLTTVTKQLPVLALLGYLYKIMNVIRDSHSPFVFQTVDCVRRIGRILLLTGIFGEAVLQMGMGLLVFHVPYLMNPLDISWIFAGVVVLLSGGILEWGCELQEFSDETL